MPSKNRDSQSADIVPLKGNATIVITAEVTVDLILIERRLQDIDDMIEEARANRCPGRVFHLMLALERAMEMYKSIVGKIEYFG